MNIVAGKAKQICNSWWAVVIIASLVSVVLYQRWQLTHRDSESLAGLAKGDQINVVTVETLQGVRMKLADTFQAQPTILYGFSPSCQWCKKNYGAMRETAEVAIKRGFRFIGVSTTRSGLKAYLEKYPAPFPVYVLPDPAPAISLNIAATPLTALISREGIVKNVIYGSYEGRNREEVERLVTTKQP
jgi:peroxiredoxin